MLGLIKFSELQTVSVDPSPGEQFVPGLIDNHNGTFKNVLLPVSGFSGGGSQTLAQTLALGNSTGPKSISIDTGQAIVSEDMYSGISITSGFHYAYNGPIAGETAAIDIDTTQLSLLWDNNAGNSFTLIAGASDITLSHTDKIILSAPLIEIKNGSLIESTNGFSTIDFQTGTGVVVSFDNGTTASASFGMNATQSNLSWTDLTVVNTHVLDVNGYQIQSTASIVLNAPYTTIGSAAEIFTANGNVTFVQNDDTLFQNNGGVVEVDCPIGFFNASTSLQYSTASRILSTDSLKNITTLDTATYPTLAELAFLKGVTSPLQGQINPLIGGVVYIGVWNATTNSPTIVNGTGTNGNYYKVSVAGTTTIDGNTNWHVGDWIVFNGLVWEKVDNYETHYAGISGVTISGFNISLDNSYFNGDATIISGAITLASVISANTKGAADKSLTITYDTKGRLTAVTENSIAIAESQVTNLVTDLAAKQATLVSGTNIKTVNGSSLLGSGNLVVGDLISTNNLSDLTSASTARTNLGLAVGTNVQAYDIELAAIAGLISAANKLPYFTGSGTAALADFTPAGFSITLSANATIGGTNSGDNAANTTSNTYADGKVSDTAYGSGWDGITTIAPSKNAIYDQVVLLAPIASPTFTGTVTLAQDAVSGLQPITYQQFYAELGNLSSKDDVAYCATSPLPANTYNNGSSGVGATWTGNSNGPLIIDGVTILLAQAGERVLIAGEANAANNGWATITQVGVVAVSPYILTRDTHSDQASEIGAGYLTSVVSPNGVVAGSNNGKVFISIANDPFVVGTTLLSFSQVGNVYSAGNGIGISGTTISIDTSVAVDKTTAQTLTNKTLTTPTIASFTNATHNHQNAAGGNTLDATAIFGATIVPVANGGSGVATLAALRLAIGDAIIFSSNTPASVGATTSDTLLYASSLINSISAGDLLEFAHHFIGNNNANTKNIRLYVNTANVLNGSEVLLTTGSETTVTARMKIRVLNVLSNTTIRVCVAAATSLVSDYAGGTANVDTTITVPSLSGGIYFLITGQKPTSIGDTVTLDRFWIRQSR